MIERGWVHLSRAYTYRVHLPNDDSRVFGASCQFSAVVGELAEPDFVTVLCEDLLRVAGELFPAIRRVRCSQEARAWHNN